MSGAVDTATERTHLSKLAVELRIAIAVAVAHGSWFAPTLDDCRLDVERELGLGDAHADAAKASSLIGRSELVLRTWRRIVAVTGIGKLPDRCRDCGGTVVSVARSGRMIPFRGRDVEVPAHFAIPTCAACGAEALDAPTAARLDAALFAAYVTLDR